MVREPAWRRLRNPLGWHHRVGEATCPRVWIIYTLLPCPLPQVTVDGTTVTVDGQFDLATPLIEANIDGSHETVQLIKLGSAGEIRIR